MDKNLKNRLAIALEAKSYSWGSDTAEEEEEEEVENQTL